MKRLGDTIPDADETQIDAKVDLSTNENRHALAISIVPKIINSG